jgi:hypothetical protein
MTHPSTLKRIEHIAHAGNIAPERLQQILAHHQQEQQAGRAATQLNSQPTSQPNDHYPVPESANHVLTTIVHARRATNNLWLLIAAHVLPPALVVWSVHKLHLTGWPAFAAYTAGTLFSLIVYSLLTVSLSLRGRRQLRRAFTQKFLHEGIQLPETNQVLMGFSPASTPRFYVSGYDWDTGFLLLLRDRIIFLGDKVRFALKPEQLVSIRLGPAGPGWWTSRRIYLDWRDTGNNRQGTFNLSPSEPTSVSKFKSQPESLLTDLQNWQRNISSYPATAASLTALESPSLVEVTSQSPKELSRGNKAFAMAVLILLIGYGVATLLSLSPWYLFAVILLLRLYELIPHWRYREQPERISHQSSPPQVQANAAR